MGAILNSKPSKLGISPGSKIIFNSIGASNGGYLNTNFRFLLR
jgi:hypothetical protein